MTSDQTPTDLSDLLDSLTVDNDMFLAESLDLTESNRSSLGAELQFGTQRTGVLIELFKVFHTNHNARADSEAKQSMTRRPELNFKRKIRISIRD